MQFCQPGFSNYGQPFVYNTSYQYQPSNNYPEVIGEGNVTSVMAPDGSTQYVFVPTTQWWQPNPGSCNINSPSCNPAVAVWYIRSVFNPMQPMSCQLPPSKHRGGTGLHRSNSSDFSISKNPHSRMFSPNFELKFHNDMCTSTSDMHHFYPGSRADADVNTSHRRSAVVQFDVPATTSTSRVVQCTQPCTCARTAPATLEPMSCDSDDSHDSHDSHAPCRCHKHKPRRTQRGKHNKNNKPLKVNRSDIVCTCKQNKDKSVATYSDRGCGAGAAASRETQTAAATPVRNARSKDIKIEVWLPHKPSKSDSCSSSNTRLGGGSSATCGTCSCRSDTE